MSGQLAYPTYENLGVRPLINCRGTFTIISGSLILPEVRQAMVEASKQYVHLDELMEAVGDAHRRADAVRVGADYQWLRRGAVPSYGRLRGRHGPRENGAVARHYGHEKPSSRPAEPPPRVRSRRAHGRRRNNRGRDARRPRGGAVGSHGHAVGVWRCGRAGPDLGSRHGCGWAAARRADVCRCRGRAAGCAQLVSGAGSRCGGLFGRASACAGRRRRVWFWGAGNCCRQLSSTGHRTTRWGGR